MFLTQHAGVVNGITPKIPTDGRNGRTPEEWLYAILYSGQVTRVGQHLALVLFHLANEKGVASLSMRDLQSITGWGRTTISDHLGEIEVFIKTTFGRGRAKSIFELQGIITEAIEQVRSVRQPDTTGNEPTNSVREADSIPDTKSTVRIPDTKPDANPISVRQPDTKPEMGGTIGGETSLTNSNSTSTSHPDAAREVGVGHGVMVNCQTIRHPNFTISIQGVAMRCQAAGLSTDEIKSKLTGIALQWAAEIENGKKPKDVLPAVMNTALARTIMGDRFQEDIQHTRKNHAAQRTSPSAASKDEAKRQIAAIVGRRT